MDLEKLSSEYDKVYNNVNELFKEHNPCQFRDGKCIRNRKDEASGLFRPDSILTKDGCCGSTGCKNLRPYGCSVKALGCSLHICVYAHEKCSEYFKHKLNEFEKETVNKFGFSVRQCYRTKEQLLEQIENTGRLVSQFEIDHD